MEIPEPTVEFGFSWKYVRLLSKTFFQNKLMPMFLALSNLELFIFCVFKDFVQMLHTLSIILSNI